MLVVTNYPQVPIATSNVATDLARADNQQAKPILPPQELSKAHQERAYNQQNERLTRHELIEQKTAAKAIERTTVNPTTNSATSFGAKRHIPTVIASCG